ncbi:MAG: hypothetical protein PHI02_03145 [Sulfurovaceae bacterium]|nr:hypothetical protein [Sulfurovaceae bacterium]
MSKQNQHYVNKSLVKRFSGDGKTINTVHLYRRLYFHTNSDGAKNIYYQCEKVSNIVENASIKELAFCSNDSYSKSNMFWDSELESLFNDRIENNLLSTLFDSNRKTKKTVVLEDSIYSRKYGIIFEQINVSNKIKSRINAFMHILTVASHYELFQEQESLKEYINGIEDNSRLTAFDGFKLFHIKFDKAKSIGKLILNEFPARYRYDEGSRIDYLNPPIDCGDIIVGEYEILLMCHDEDYVQRFMMANIVFEDDVVNLQYTTCVGYLQSVKKSIVFASKDPEDLDDIVDLFNSQEFRNYVGGLTSKKKPIIAIQNNKIWMKKLRFTLFHLS